MGGDGPTLVAGVCAALRERGLVNVHLLASTILHGAARLWTEDTRLASVAATLELLQEWKSIVPAGNVWRGPSPHHTLVHSLQEKIQMRPALITLSFALLLATACKSKEQQAVDDASKQMEEAGKKMAEAAKTGTANPANAADAMAAMGVSPCFWS